MKKTQIAIVLIVVAIVVVLFSCSQEKLGNFMSGMGNNVYGIKPDLRKPNAAISIVDKISESDSLNLSLSGELISTVQDFKGSPNSVKAFRDSMSEKVDTSPAAFIEVRDGMRSKAGEIKGDESFDKDARDMMVILDDVAAAITEDLVSEPTRRDVITVAMVNQLVDDIYNSVKDGTFNVNSVSKQAQGVLDVLKLSTDFSSLNFIGDIDFDDLIDSLLVRKEMSRANSKAVVSVVGTTIGKVTGLITEEGVYNDARYERFRLEAKSVMVAYELSMSPAFSDFYSFLDGPSNRFGMVTDDLTTFLSTAIVSLMDRLPNEAWKTFLSTYVQGNNVVALSDLKNNASKLENPVSYFEDTFYDTVAGEFGIEAVDMDEDGTPESRGKVLKMIIGNVHDNITQTGGFSLVTMMQFLSPMLEEIEKEDVETEEDALTEVVNIVVDGIVEELSSIGEGSSEAATRLNYFMMTFGGILIDTNLMTALTLL